MKRELDYITAADGTRVPFDEFITMSPLQQHTFLNVRGVSKTAEQRQRHREGAVTQRRGVITPLGEFMSMSEAAKAHGLWGSNGIKLRIERGWAGYRYK